MEKKELKTEQKVLTDDKDIERVFDDEKSQKNLSSEVEKQLNDIAGDVDELKVVDADNEQIISEEVVKDKLEEVATKTAPGKRLKNTISSIILLVVNIVLVYLLASSLLKNSGVTSISSLIEVCGTRLNFLWGAVVCFVLVMLADTLFIGLILKTTTKKFRLGLSYKASAVGKYYEAITPFCAGGQPAQIVYLSKHKVAPGIATSVPIIRVTLINFATIFVSLFLFVFHVPNITGGNGFIDILIGILEILAYIGLIINTLYFIAVFIIANSKVVGRTLARTMVRVGYKLKIFKDYRSAYKKIINQVTEYRNSIDYLKRHWVALLFSIVLVLIEILALASIPFFVTLGLADISFVGFAGVFKFWAECLVMYYICYFASSYIPLPGGTGMMEIAFVILFSGSIGSSFVAWGFLLWRFASYYSTIIQGFILTIFDTIKGCFKRKIDN